MNRFVETFQPTAETTVLDVSGTPYNWERIDARFSITLLNIEPLEADRHGARYTLIRGSGTQLDFPDRSFDIAFSNSVIEHVGSLDAQRAFANQLRRVDRQLWVQTPARSVFSSRTFLRLLSTFSRSHGSVASSATLRSGVGSPGRRERR